MATEEAPVLAGVADCVKPIKSEEEYSEFISRPGLNLVHFYASFVNSCFDLNEILQEFQKEHSDIFQSRVIYAEDFPQQSKEMGITAVPTVVFFKDGKAVDKLEGFHPLKLRETVFKHHFVSKPINATNTSSKPPLEERLKALINTSRLTLFMKGDRNYPKCGFSRQICDLLRSHDAEFWTFDILTDNEVREGLKVYSDWPTYPQLYLDGELLGGLDVIREEMKNPEFVEKLPKFVVVPEENPNNSDEKNLDVNSHEIANGSYSSTITSPRSSTTPTPGSSATTTNSTIKTTNESSS